jgi:hypothetical protein
MLKTLFFRWKNTYYPEIQFSMDQIVYINIYFNNVKSGSSEPLPDVKGKSVVQMLIAGFWEDNSREVFGR